MNPWGIRTVHTEDKRRPGALFYFAWTLTLPARPWCSLSYSLESIPWLTRRKSWRNWHTARVIRPPFLLYKSSCTTRLATLFLPYTPPDRGAVPSLKSQLSEEHSLHTSGALLWPDGWYFAFTHVTTLRLRLEIHTCGKEIYEGSGSSWGADMSRAEKWWEIWKVKV